MEQFDTTIVIPVLDDWEAFAMLVGEIERVLGKAGGRVCIVAVNDGSTRVGVTEETFRETPLRIDLVHLRRNLGHQRAIAIGLSHVKEHFDCRQAVVMDADGEDRPEDIVRLLESSRNHPDALVFAARARRSEGLGFRAFYAAYRLVFRLLTGKSISFGNFCLVPKRLLDRMVYVSDIWSHFAAGAVRTRLPIVLIPTDRGKRFTGHPKMNLTSLVSHGLNAVSVFGDTMAVRVTAFSLGLILVTALGFGALVGIRFLTDLAIPGWASTVAFGLAILFMQAFSMSMLFVLIIHSYRTQRSFIPILDYRDLVLSVETLREAPW